MSALSALIEGASQHEPLVAVVAGSGLVTRCAVEAGAHLLLALSAGVYRTYGVGSLGAFLPFRKREPADRAAFERAPAAPASWDARCRRLVRGGRRTGCARLGLDEHGGGERDAKGAPDAFKIVLARTGDTLHVLNIPATGFRA